MRAGIGTADDDMHQVWHRVDQGCERRQQRLRHEQRPRARVPQHVVVVAGGQLRVDGDRNDSRLDRAEERRREVDRIVERQQDPLLAANAQPGQCVGKAVDASGELLVRGASGVVDIRKLPAAAGVEIAADQVGGGVEHTRGNHRDASSRTGNGSVRQNA